MNFETLFVDPRGRTSRSHYMGALAALLAAYVFYHYLIFGPYKIMGMIVLLLPALVLHANRLRDMGRPVWLLIIPLVPIAADFYPRMMNPNPFAPAAVVEPAVTWAALGVSGVFVLWCLVAKGQGEADRLGEAAAP